jgi:hypothetical protein
VREGEDFNKLVGRGSGQLADKAKREEYERLMREKKKTKPPEPDRHHATGPHNTCCGDL